MIVTLVETQLTLNFSSVLYFPHNTMKKIELIRTMIVIHHILLVSLSLLLLLLGNIIIFY